MSAMLRRPRSRTVRMSALCLGLLALGWLLTPLTATPPLYDGLGFPDEPYRYVVAPPGYQHTAAPSVGEDDGIVFKGVGPQLLLPVSDENGPQVQAGIPASQLSIPAGTTQLAAKATPLALTGAAPSDGTVWGNVYRVTVTSDRGPVAATGRPTSDSVISLRAPSAQQPAPVMEYRATPGAPWQDLRTTRVGNDIYQSPLPGLGDYALVRVTHHAAPAASPGVSPAREALRTLPWVLAGLLAAFAPAILAVRLHRRRSGEA
ncbi:hypothetical protein [Streptacidiphilus jiangxiensis]|uniref:Uncharacterized protein n=1 Tax=Streptacidiphilus jiangxiensis TaxID=235985 RepID=A0A1H7V500_STRJI|nr:hypothetical protein [Streptacidiphilus jiangxiensis]SEM04263.1 hypothetical protein SAMN05414137_11787 [Streptacidiphilus jiangxiensis]